jgi:DNA-binding XRE family transcriptional regulator
MSKTSDCIKKSILDNILAIYVIFYYIWIIYYLKKMYSLEPTPLEVSIALAEKHRTLRKRLKMSQEEIAERSGLSLGSLKRFENTGKISLDSLLKLMHLLGRLNEFDNLLLLKENPDDIKKLFTE